MTLPLMLLGAAVAVVVVAVIGRMVVGAWRRGRLGRERRTSRERRRSDLPVPMERRRSERRS